MDHLTPTDLAEFRALLETERAALVDRAARLRDESAGLPPDSGDRQDAAALEASRAELGTLASRDRTRLTAIEAALHRLDTGTYGICDETDEPIPAARLRLEPTTRYTVEAQAELEAAADSTPDDDAVY